MEQKAAAETQHPETAAYDPPPQLDAALAEIALVEAKKTPKTIGYLTNYSFHIWYQIVIEILKRRGAQYGAEIVIKDANLSVENQIAQAREMLPKVDAIILTPAATEGLEEILKLAKDAGKPVAVEANPVDGMATLVAICDYDAGFDMGVWVGRMSGTRTVGRCVFLMSVCRRCVRVCSGVWVSRSAFRAFSQMQKSSHRSTAKPRRRSHARSLSTL